MRNFILFICISFCIFSCKKETNQRIKKSSEQINPQLDTLKFNQIQCIGSHNSYRKRTDPDIYKLVSAIGGILPSDLNPKAWDYTHIPFNEQFDLGVRSLELDIYYDPAGGRYYKRIGNALVGKSVDSRVPELMQPGMKMMHIPDVDYNTHYYTFKSGLKAIKEWSNQNPSHLPIVLLVEYKEFGVGNVLPFFTKILPFTEQAVNDVDQEIIDVFGANSSQIFRPDDLRKTYPNLKTAIQQEGWPKISTMRGKIIFVFYANNLYTKNHPNLEGRMMFQFSPLGSDNGAFVKMDGSEEVSKIQAAVKAGAIIRTRSDSDTEEARTGNTKTREDAFNSGAQIISTDYYLPDSRAGQKGWTDYKVIFPTQNFARVNVVNAPEIIKGEKIVE